MRNSQSPRCSKETSTTKALERVCWPVYTVFNGVSLPVLVVFLAYENSSSGKRSQRLKSKKVRSSDCRDFSLPHALTISNASMGDPAGESDQASFKVGLGQLSSYCWSKPTCSSYKVSKQVEYKQLMN